MRFPFIRRKVYDELLREKKQIDWLMWVAGLVGPISTIPQVIIIFANKSASDVSMLSWVLYTISTVIFLLYSIIHKVRPMVINSLLWLLADIAVITGVILYGKA